MLSLLLRLTYERGRTIGALVMSPSFMLTVWANHTHLAHYTRTVSLHRVSLVPLISGLEPLPSRKSISLQLSPCAVPSYGYSIPRSPAAFRAHFICTSSSS